jgi:hypothetical protein
MPIRVATRSGRTSTKALLIAGATMPNNPEKAMAAIIKAMPLI